MSRWADGAVSCKRVGERTEIRGPSVGLSTDADDVTRTVRFAWTLKNAEGVAGQYVWHGADCAAARSRRRCDSERRDSLGRDVVMFVFVAR